MSGLHPAVRRRARFVRAEGRLPFRIDQTVPWDVRRIMLRWRSGTWGFMRPVDYRQSR